MKSTFKILLLSLLLCFGSAQLRAQNDKQTRANALEREKAAKAQKQAEYDAHLDHISELQGKKVQTKFKFLKALRKLNFLLIFQPESHHELTREQ